MDTVVRCTLLLPLTALQAAVLVQEGRSRSRGRGRREQVQRSRSSPAPPLGAQGCRKRPDQTERHGLEVESARITSFAEILETAKEGDENKEKKDQQNKASVDWPQESLKLVRVRRYLLEYTFQFLCHSLQYDA